MYQVRVTEVAVKTRFGKVVDEIVEPGVGFKMPWPIERIQRFDRRVQSFQDKFDETLTQDGRNLMVMLYLGWSIESPATFRDRIKDGSIDEAERNLMSIVRSKKLEVVGQYPFSAFINTDEAKLKFTEIEGKILELIQPQAASTYGIKIHFLGIKRLQLPPAITDKVFERMRAERMKLVQTYTSEGQATATRIVTEADRDRAEKLAYAENEAKRIMGEADAAASASYEVFQQEPELAIFLLKLDALETSLQDRATLFLDTTTSPFDILAKPESKPTK
jgi:membrane protease subunit HflC